jgi:hypothetical protein
MRLPGKPWKILGAAGVVLLLAACDQGPLEKAGKSVDRAVEKRAPRGPISHPLAKVTDGFPDQGSRIPAGNLPLEAA